MAATEVQHTVQREPHQFGLPHSRWSLRLIQQVLPWLRPLSRPSVHRLLRRLRIVWKRPRASIRSPDAAYQSKLDQIALHLGQARASDACRVLFLDEVTIERQPTLAMAYAPRGPEQARARLSHAANTLTRIVATLDALSGRVIWQRAAHITVAGLVGFYRQLCEAYPDVPCLYVVQDNWPVHTHPDLLVALQPQSTPFAFHRPSNWPTTPSPSAERKGQQELDSSIDQPDRPRNPGRKQTEERLPRLLDNLKTILAGQSQIDATFQSTRLYTRPSVRAIRAQLIEQHGYRDEELQDYEVLRQRINALGYRLRAVKKNQPKKSSPRPTPSSQS